MATSTVTHITDDIDGSAEARTVTFGFQGVGYSIDLSQKNMDKLTKALTPFIEHATRSRGTSAAPASRPPARSRSRATSTPDREYDVAALRAWAGKNKLTVKGRGRIPRSVVEQYLAAGGR